MALKSHVSTDKHEIMEKMTEITLKKENGISTFTKPKGRKFKALILTDLHIACGFRTKKKDKLATDAITKIVMKADPDFIIVNGDLTFPIVSYTGTGNNKKQAQYVSDLFDGFKIPWAHVYGNHDEEKHSKLNKPQLSEIYKKGQYSLFESGPKDIFGEGNYVVDLKNADGTHNTTFFFMDSNQYLGKGFFTGYDHIHEDQLAWYKSTIDQFSAKEGKLINSLLFCHIPVREFAEAWKLCWRGSPEVKYHLGFVQEKDNYFGFPKSIKTGLFDAVLEKGSTKGLFFGHDHYSCLSLTYKGVRMSYPMSIDYTGYIGIKNRFSQRGGTLLYIDDDGNFDLEHLPLLDVEPSDKYAKKHV